MSRRKVAVTTFVVSALAAFAVGPHAARGGTVEIGTGKTSTVVDLVDLNLTQVPVLGSVGASLGIASSDATTSGKPESSIGIQALTFGGQSHGSHRVSSNDAQGSESVSVPISAAGVTGLLQIAELSATATDTTAEAILSALSGDVNVGPLNIGTSMPANGIHSLVDEDSASSTMGASFGPISVGLGDLVPADILGQLPLGAVLDLVDTLGLSLPADITDQLTVVTDLLDTVEGLEQVMGQLEKATEELAQLTEGIPSVDAAQDAVDAAQTQVDAATATIDTLTAQMATAQSTMAASQSDAATAQSEIDTINSQITGLQSQKAILQGQLALCGGVPTVCDPIQAQIDAIDAQLLTHGEQLTAAEAELAAAEAGIAAAQSEIDSATAALTTAQGVLDAAMAQLDAAQAALDEVLETVSTPQIDAIKGLIDTLQAQIESLLGQIETLLGNVGDLDTLLDTLIGLLDDAEVFSIGEITARVDSAADAARGTASVVCEASGIEVLGNPVGGGGCDSITGALNQLTSAVDDVLRSLPVRKAIPSVTAEGLKASEQASPAPDASGVTEAVAKLTGLHIAVPSISLKDVVDDVLATAIQTVEDTIAQLPAGVTVPAEIGSVLDQVMTQVQQLPTGDLLGGLRTMGIDAKVAGLTSRSSFQARAPQTNNPNDPDPTDPKNPETTTPEQRNELPFTGSPTSLVLALALWLMVAGMVAMVLADRRSRSHI